MKWNLFTTRRVVGCFFLALFALTGSAFAEKSMWQKFKDFFSPGEHIDCSGPVCDELHDVESKANKMEGRYSRERRPVNKERYKKELDSLNVVRDSLIAVIKAQQAADSLKTAKPTSSGASSAAVSSVAVPKSSSAVAPVLSSAAGTLPACKPDTVFVHDTVIVRDTLFVMLANKPAEIPAAAPVAADSAATSMPSK